MSPLDPHEAVQQIEPVFVTAHNGITLIRQLLNSSRKIIVYGENEHFVQTLPKLVYDHVSLHQQLGQHLDTVRERFLH